VLHGWWHHQQLPSVKLAMLSAAQSILLKHLPREAVASLYIMLCSAQQHIMLHIAL